MVPVYAYWDKGVEKMPEMIRYIYNHNTKMAAKHKFTYTLITDNTIYDYIQKEELPDVFWKLAPNFKSDIVRFLILHATGGVWLDTDVFIIKDITPLYTSLLESGKDAIFDIEYGTKIGCASLVVKKNSAVSAAMIEYVRNVLQRKCDRIGWNDLGPFNVTKAYQMHPDRIILNTYDTVRKGCNYICWNTRPGENDAKWYLTPDTAKAVAAAIFTEPTCYYSITWTIYRSNCANVKQKVFDDERSIFYHLTRLCDV